MTKSRQYSGRNVSNKEHMQKSRFLSPSKKARSCLFGYSKRIKPDFDDLRADDGEDTIITALDLRRNNRRKNFEQQMHIEDIEI